MPLNTPILRWRGLCSQMNDFFYDNGQINNFPIFTHYVTLSALTQGKISELWARVTNILTQGKISDKHFSLHASAVYVYCLLSIYSILSVLSACKASVEVLNCNLPVIIAPPLYRCELEELPSWSSVRNIMSVSTVNQENNFHSKACFELFRYKWETFKKRNFFLILS